MDYLLNSWPRVFVLVCTYKYQLAVIFEEVALWLKRL